MFVWAIAGSQLSVYDSPTFLMSPESIASFRTSSWPDRRKSAFASVEFPLMNT